MINEKKIFTNGINADDDLMLLTDGEYLNLLNGRVSVSENGKALRIENVLGNVLLENPYLPSGNNQTIGTAVDYARKRLIYFNWNSNGEDGVYAYDINTNTFYKVLVNSNLIPGVSQLTTTVIIAGGGISGVAADVEYFGYIKQGDTLSITVGKDTGSGIIDPFTVSITVRYYETFASALTRLVTLFNANAIAISYGLSATVGSTIHTLNAILINFNGSNWICQSNLVLSTFANKPLNFSKDFRIDRNAKVVGDLLYWCEDTQNQPRKVNIEAGIKTNHPAYVTGTLPYSLPIDYKWIHWIKRPPVYPLVWEKKVKPTSFIETVDAVVFDQDFDGYFIKFSASDYTTLVIDVSDVFLFSGTASNNIAFNVVNIISISGGTEYKVYVFQQTTTEAAASPIQVKQIGAPATNLIKDTAFYFAYYYTFRDNEDSALSMFSKIAEPSYFDTYERNFRVADADNFNTIYNCLKVTIPFDETISPEIKYVNLCVKIGQNGKVFKVGILDADNVLDAFVIKNHNQLIRQATLLFYNNNDGLALDSVFSNASFDGVPLNVKTFDISKNRSFPANNIFGYTPPFQTSLVATANYFDFSSGITNLYRKVFGYSSKHQLCVTFYDEFKRPCGIVTSNNATVFTEGRIPLSSNDIVDDYKVCSDVSWALSNTNAIAEIPNWAHYYSVGMTENLNYGNTVINYAYKLINNTLVYYGRKSSSTGDYTYSLGDFNPLGNKANVIAVKIGVINAVQSVVEIVGYKEAYSFDEGDCAYFYYLHGEQTTSTYIVYRFENIKVIGVDGNYILLDGKDIGTLPDAFGTGGYVQAYVLVFKKKKQALLAQYYETGDMFKINNPGKNTRAYATLSGILYGDVYSVIIANLSNINIAIQTMSNNTNAMFISQSNDGFVNKVDTIGQTHLTDSIAFSDTYIQGTKVNGLNKFQPLNRKTVGSENGIIQKMQLTNKQQEDGKVMLVICNNSTLSAYLGEVQTVASAKNANIAISEEVIGTINALKLTAGTQDPSTVTEINGEVYWFCALNGYWVQYSVNGLYPISNYKLQRFFKEWAKLYKSTSSATLDTLNGFHHLTGCYDPYHKEVIATLPALIDESAALKYPSYNGITPSYASNINNQEDVFDKLGKTIAFDPEKNKWVNSLEYTPEWMEYLDNTLFTFKNGQLYQQNVNNGVYNTFFGEQKALRIIVSLSSNPSAVKGLYNLAVEGSAIPDFAVLHCTYPNEQITDLAADDVDINGKPVWVNIEGVYYAAFLRDRLSPNVDGSVVKKMNEGDFIKSVSPALMLEFQQYNKLVRINFINIGYEISRSQSTILK